MADTLVVLVAQLRDVLSQVRLVLPLPGAKETKQWVAMAISQLDDYVVPRLQAIEAPLLAVVGGSTGAGKSTLVNSLVGKVVTAPGVIRPTTKAPVLIHHPDDADRFTTDRILPGLARSAESTNNARSLQIVASEAVHRGLALLDAPDIDSIDVDNRNLAVQLLSAADLWLFVTSAARYADAVPWEFLREAARRSAAVAVVVDRVPPAAMSAVPEHLAQMMIDAGLADSPLFAVPETVTDKQGLLPASAVQPIQAWLGYLSSSQVSRAQIVLQTLDGALAALESGLGNVADRLTEQDVALARLRADAVSFFDLAKRSARVIASDGTLLRGEVMARWQDFVGTGEIMRSLESRVSRMRDWVVRRIAGSTDKVVEVQTAVKVGLESLVVEAGRSAVARTEAAWLADPAGRYIIEATGFDSGHGVPDYSAQVEDAIRRWQDDVVRLVQEEGAGRRTKARLAALGVNVAGVCLMLVAFAHTAGLTGAEIGIAGGTAVVAQKGLELIFGDDAIRRLAATAADRLGSRIDQVLDAQLEGLLAATLDRFRGEVVTTETLAGLAAKLGAARVAEMNRVEGIATDEMPAELVDVAPAEEPDRPAKKGRQAAGESRRRSRRG